jgi:dipeptidyl aminopeptidase/acylaminoacyl peptidase
MMHGEKDSLVQAELLFTWLYENGVEVEFIKYLGEGHMISQPEHIKDRWTRTRAWFHQHMGTD